MMAGDIRIGADAFDFAGAWLAGVQAGQRQSQTDLMWAQFLEKTEAANRAEQRLVADRATRDANIAVAQDAQYNASTAADAAAGADGKGGSVAGPQRDSANYIMNRLVKQHGYSREAAAALVGNWIQESSLNTTARNRGDGKDGSDSIGIAQWNSGRAQALKAYAQQRGTAWTDLNTQIDFAAQELNSSHRSVGAMLRRPGISVAEASQIIHRRYEVAEPASAGRRLSNSQAVYGAFDPNAASAKNVRVLNRDGSYGSYGDAGAGATSTDAAPAASPTPATSTTPVDPPAPSTTPVNPPFALPTSRVGTGAQTPGIGNFMPPSLPSPSNPVQDFRTNRVVSQNESDFWNAFGSPPQASPTIAAQLDPTTGQVYVPLGALAPPQPDPSQTQDLNAIDPSFFTVA